MPSPPVRQFGPRRSGLPQRPSGGNTLVCRCWIPACSTGSPATSSSQDLSRALARRDEEVGVELACAVHRSHRRTHEVPELVRIGVLYRLSRSQPCRPVDLRLRRLVASSSLTSGTSGGELLADVCQDRWCRINEDGYFTAGPAGSSWLRSSTVSVESGLRERNIALCLTGGACPSTSRYLHGPVRRNLRSRSAVGRILAIRRVDLFLHWSARIGARPDRGRARQRLALACAQRRSARAGG